MALNPQNRRSNTGKKIFAVLVLAAVGAGGVLLKRELTLAPAPTITITHDLPAIGAQTTFKVSVHGAEGIACADVTVAGSALKAPLAKVLRAADAVSAALPQDLTTDVVVGKALQTDLVPGQVTVTVTAAAQGTRLRTAVPVTQSVTLDVKLDPPALSASSSFVYPAQGGTEVVVYDVGPSSVKDGVQVGTWFFPGAPLPGGAASQHMAMFGIPYDMDASEADAKARVLLVASDVLGNSATTQFIHKYIARPMGKDTIKLTEPFMLKVTGEIYARTPELQKPAGLLDAYLKLNGALRLSNMAELLALQSKTAPRFLWKQTFLPMKDAAVKGSFADRRTYQTDDGTAVDTQDHLGFDLASVKSAPVQAANDGVVVLAKYFGIFGNCVVIDHGYGLMTLYAHLSTLGVKEGDAVVRGQEIAKVGATGLAGGDHLHFTTLLWGLPVNPVEWWDAHWIKDRVKLKLGDALPWVP